MHYLAQFLMFFAQTITIAATIILILIAFIAVIAKAKQKAKEIDNYLKSTGVSQ